MNMLTAVAVAVAVSSLCGTLLYVAIAGPLRSLLKRACPDNDAARFWQRLTLVMLYLLPVLLAVLFGTPSMTGVRSAAMGVVVLHSAIASLVGGLIVLAVMGRWVRMISQASFDPSTRPQGPSQNDLPRDKAR